MMKIRMVEQYIARRYPEQEMKCPTHLCIGQEAVPAVFGCLAEKGDVFMGTYRSHGHYLAKGGDMTKLFAELLGKPSGCAHGFGGSMHLIDTGHSLMGTSAIVGSGVPIAAGASFALKYLGRCGIAVVFFGDGALEEGVLYETVNFAMLHKLPLLMICENNGLAVDTPLTKRQASTTLHNRFESWGLSGIHIDHHDLSGLITAAKENIEYVRKRAVPAFIEYTTTRMAVHVGHEIRGAVDAWWHDPFSSEAEDCPIARLARLLIEQKKVSLSDMATWRRGLQTEIESAYETAKQSTDFKGIDLTQHVHASPLHSTFPSSSFNTAPQTFSKSEQSKLANPF